jgi:hypothetical protein
MTTTAYTPATATLPNGETAPVYAVRILATGDVSVVALPAEMAEGDVFPAVIATAVSTDWATPVDVAVNNGLGIAPVDGGAPRDGIAVRVGWAHGDVDESSADTMPVDYAREAPVNLTGDALFSRWGFYAEGNTVTTNGTVWFLRYGTDGALEPIDAADLSDILHMTDAEDSAPPLFDLSRAFVDTMLRSLMGEVMGDAGPGADLSDLPAAEPFDPFAGLFDGIDDDGGLDLSGLAEIDGIDVVTLDPADDDGFAAFLDSLGLGGDVDFSDYDDAPDSDDDDPAEYLPVIRATDVRVFAVDADHPEQTGDASDARS